MTTRCCQGRRIIPTSFRTTAARAGRQAARVIPAVWLCLCLGAAVSAGGCGGPLRFPAEPVDVSAASAGKRLSYDTDGDGTADYLAVTNEAGRIIRIGYAPSGGEPEAMVALDGLPTDQCRHLVLILDGVGYETVRAWQAGGRLRLFYPPAPVISTYPSMTDIALADVFQSIRPLGYEARYFDHARNAIRGGDADYLAMTNEDWVRCTDYRAGTLVDPLAYLFPRHYFKEEMKALVSLLKQRDRPMIVAYLVSTAGLGTKHLAEGQEEILRDLDRLTHQLVWESRGLMKITVFSDHGHQLVPAEWIDFRAFLRERGWDVTERLGDPKDAVVIDYGLVTYASFATRSAPALSEALLEHEGVDVVTYASDGRVIVESDEGRARIEQRGDRYRYVRETGDPLHLAEILKRAADEGVLDADGFARDRAWLHLTADHEYPDPVVRIWRGFHGLTEHVPDVIASLKDGYSAGLPSRAARYPEGASTHGDLARKSSTAFIMSTAGPVPEADRPLRSRDLPKVLADLLVRPWPPPREATP